MTLIGPMNTHGSSLFNKVLLHRCEELGLRISHLTEITYCFAACCSWTLSDNNVPHRSESHVPVILVNNKLCGRTTCWK